VDVTYYFDGSDAPATDTGANWNAVTNADDGSTSTFASTFALLGSLLRVEGTNAPGTLGTITQVKFRGYGSTAALSAGRVRVYENGGTALLGTNGDFGVGNRWSSYTTLTTHSGGWDASKLQALQFDADIDDAITPTFYLARVEILVSLASPVAWLTA
jgi:hypothetical protein